MPNGNGLSMLRPDFYKRRRAVARMAEHEESGASAKVYCTHCDRVFDSRKQYDLHVAELSSYGGSGGASCESCPLDTAVSKLLGLFRRK